MVGVLILVWVLLRTGEVMETGIPRSSALTFI